MEEANQLRLEQIKINGLPKSNPRERNESSLHFIEKCN